MADVKLRTLTLGCKVNQYETEYVRQGLVASGFCRDAAPDEPADLCVINTCTVTHEGDAKSRQAIRRLGRLNPEAKLIVMGCYATRAPDELSGLPGVVEVVTDKRELPDLLGRFGVVDIPDGISRFGDRQRAYLKIQDGCLLRCSYCIIPQVRPTMYSRSPDSIEAEARRLLANGHRELVLTGIHLGHYGVEGNAGKSKDDWNRLSTLVRRLVQLPGDFRIRLSSIEATEVTRELLQVMADHPQRVCPHLHICLQSGSDRILRRMHRRWGAQRFIDRCHLVRQMLDRPALTTDVIVGFPGETDADFADTCRVVSEVEFSKVHVFPFSARRGTPAADLPDRVDPRVMAVRGKELAEVAATQRDIYHRRLLGQPLQVLIEDRDADGASVGTTCRYAPMRLAAGAIGEFVTAVPRALGTDGFLLDA